MPAAGGASNARLNGRVLNVGWGSLRRQCAYKGEWSDGVAVAVNPA